MDIYQALGKVVERLGALEVLAQVAWRRGDENQSERLYAEELELARGVYEPGHPRLAWIISNYAYTVEHNQGLAQGELLYREAVQILRDTGAEDHRDFARCLKFLGRNLLRQEKHEEAATLLQQAADLQIKFFGAKNEIAIDTLKLLDEARNSSQSVSSQP
jgi:tetratricopeptide (TPR) repeat protein